MKTINSRIKKIRKELCANSAKEFAIKLNVSSQAISNYVRDGYNIGREVIENILLAFSEVDANWLLLGEGSMLKDSKPEAATELAQLIKSNGTLIETNQKLTEQVSKLTSMLEDALKKEPPVEKKSPAVKKKKKKETP